MFEREVTDIVIATLASFILYMITISPTDTTLVTIQIICGVGIILTNFLHLILRQLRRLGEHGSEYFTYFDILLVLASFILFIISSPEPVEGFWDIINNGYSVFIILGYIFQSLFIADCLMIKDLKEL